MTVRFFFLDFLAAPAAAPTDRGGVDPIPPPLGPLPSPRWEIDPAPTKVEEAEGALAVEDVEAEVEEEDEDDRQDDCGAELLRKAEGGATAAEVKGDWGYIRGRWALQSQFDTHLPKYYRSDRFALNEADKAEVEKRQQWLDKASQVGALHRTRTLAP